MYNLFFFFCKKETKKSIYEEKMKLKKTIKIGMVILTFGLSFNIFAETNNLEKYLLNFNYDKRIEMKIKSTQLIKLLKQNKAVLIDIRFKEEFATWRMNIAKNIPLNELPKRLKELDKNKIIVTACPHKDRAIMGMLYLKSKGYKAKYLRDGLIGLFENLRGDNAKNFIRSLNNKIKK